MTLINTNYSQITEGDEAPELLRTDELANVVSQLRIGKIQQGNSMMEVRYEKASSIGPAHVDARLERDDRKIIVIVALPDHQPPELCRIAIWEGADWRLLRTTVGRNEYRNDGFTQHMIDQITECLSSPIDPISSETETIIDSTAGRIASNTPELRLIS